MNNVSHRLKRIYACWGGRWLIGKLIGLGAPYSGTIGARVIELDECFARVCMKDKRRVRNHMNSIHACALSTLTETTAGLSVLYSLPANVRGIPTRLSVDYHAKARGLMTAECRWTLPAKDCISEPDLRVEIRNQDNVVVATGHVYFRFGPVEKRPGSSDKPAST